MSIEVWIYGIIYRRDIYPVPQNAPHVSAGMNVPNFPEGQRPKATDVSPWYGVYFPLFGNPPGLKEAPFKINLRSNGTGRRIVCIT